MAGEEVVVGDILAHPDGIFTVIRLLPHLGPGWFKGQADSTGWMVYRHADAHTKIGHDPNYKIRPVTKPEPIVDWR